VWEHVALFRHNGQHFRCLGRALHFLIAFLAMLTTCAAISSTNCEYRKGNYIDILSGKYNDRLDQAGGFSDVFCGFVAPSGEVSMKSVKGSGRPEMYAQMMVLFTLVAAMIFAVSFKLNPTEKWAHLESAAAAMECEIFLYRSRVGKYSNIEDAETQAQDNQQRLKRGEIFANTVNHILKVSLSNDMRNDFLDNPSLSERPEHCNFYDPETAARKPATRCCCRRSQKQHNLHDPLLAAKLGLPEKTETTLPQKTETLKATKEPESNAVDEPSPAGMSEMQRGTAPPQVISGKSQDDEAAADNETAAAQELESFVDDGLCELLPEQYIQARLSPMMRHYDRRVTALGGLVQGVQLFLSFLAAFTAWLAHGVKGVDTRPCVPVVVALTNLVALLAENERLRTRLDYVGESVEILAELKIWWAGLTEIEKEEHRNRSRLVTKSEEQADAEISAWQKH